jgi:PAS domain S-box-containing protein
VTRRPETGGGPSHGADSFEKAVFEQAKAGFEVYDTNLRIIRANQAILSMRGLPASAVIGERIETLDSAMRISPVVREAVETGVTVSDRRVSAHPEADSGRRHEYVVTGYPLREAGRPMGAAAMVHDVTELVRRREELDLLDTARARIGSSLDALRTSQELAAIAVPGFADAVAVDLLEAVLNGDAPIGPVTSRLPMRRAAFQGRNVQYGAYPIGGASYIAFATPHTQALADLRPRLLASVSSSTGWLLHDPSRADFVARTGAHSLIVAPLTVHGLVMGMVSYYRDSSRPDRFDEEDLSLAEELTGFTALCIDNARRFTREHTVAVTLQRSLLPRVPPEVSALESSHCYLPGRHGAHWFDVLPLSGCRVGLIIGFVRGEDLQASVAMGRLRTAASTLASMELPPNELLAHLDDVMQRLSHEQEEDPETLHHARPPLAASCLYLTYDPITGACTAASAGHGGPLVTSPGGIVSALDVARGAALGQGAPYEMRTTRLPAGTLLCMYSDSVVDGHPAEAHDRLSRLRETIGDPTAHPDEVCDAVAYKLLQGGSLDGAVVLVAKLRSLDPDRVIDWTFPPEPASVGQARRAARHQLEQWGLEEQTFATDLVVSELATNVIRHAIGPIRLRLILDRTLTVEVSDDSDTAPHLRHARIQDEGGRGLFIVASVSRHWGTRFSERGKTIWAEQELADT